MTPTEARALAAEVRARGMSSIDSALRSLADQVEALQWQPIETAPHNERVLVFYTYTNGVGRRIIATYYRAETLESEYEESGYAEPGWYEESYAADTIYPIEQEPTHWMPLPPPPHDRAREAT